MHGWPEGERREWEWLTSGAAWERRGEGEYLVAEDGVVVLVSPKLQLGFGGEWRVESDQDGSVCFCW